MPQDFFRNASITRRECVTALGAAAGSIALPQGALAAVPADTAVPTHAVAVSLQVNGAAHALGLDPRVTLLDLLREHLALTGTKKGCDHGQCGACTVLVNGRRINSCLSLAATHDGDEITTVEGLAQGRELAAIQQSFIDHDGFQCGYCTPGQICSAVAMLAEARRGDPSFVTSELSRTGPADLTDDEIRERMSGNICRWGGSWRFTTSAASSISGRRAASSSAASFGEFHWRFTKTRTSIGAMAATCR